MRLGMRLTGVLMGFLLVPGIMCAQKQEASPEKPAMTHLRVDIVLAEYDGDKKVSSLPYTMYVGVSGSGNQALGGSLRMGVRVPVAENAEGTQFNYQSIGTNIDCHAHSEGDARYDIWGTIDRSSIYSATAETSSAEQERLSGGHPILRSFNSGYELALRDGETGEGISATDPFNGHVLKVSVTIHVVK